MTETWIDFARKENIAQDSIPFDHGDWFNWLEDAAKNYHDPLAVKTGGDWNE